MPDDADAAQALEDAHRAHGFRATAGAATDERCIECDRPLEPFDRRHNPHASTCTRCRKAEARS